MASNAAPAPAILPSRSFRARLFRPMLDRIDRGLIAGRLEVSLPDGRQRVLGGRGEGPVVRLDLRRWRALARLALNGSVGWYQAWEAGEWDADDPVQLFDLFMRNRATLGGAARAQGPVRLWRWLAQRLRDNHRAGARRNVLAHYDLGNDFYAAWLDPTLTYSSAMFDGDTSQSLEAAQQRKVAAILDRLALAPGERLLEIGCGWGHVARTAAARGLAVTALTLSPAQKAHAEAVSSDLPHPPRFELTDYRDAKGQCDGIASVEMVEAVGQRHWGDYLDTIARLLKPGGRAAIQYIAIADDVFPAYATSQDFIQHCIFPGGMLLSESRFRALAEARGLAWSDPVHFGADYAETLKRWRTAFDAAVAEARLPAGFDARFIRLWRYYLMYCEGGFQSGGISVAQVTLVRQGSDCLTPN